MNWRDQNLYQQYTRQKEAEKENIKLQEDLSTARDGSLQASQSSEKLKIDLNHIEEKLSNSEKKSKALAEKVQDL